MSAKTSRIDPEIRYCWREWIFLGRVRARSRPGDGCRATTATDGGIDRWAASGLRHLRPRIGEDVDDRPGPEYAGRAGLGGRASAPGPGNGAGAGGDHWGRLDAARDRGI